VLRLDRRAKGQPLNALPSHEGNFGGTLRDRAVRRMVVPSRQPRLPARTGLASVAFVLGAADDPATAPARRLPRPPSNQHAVPQELVAAALLFC